MAKINKKEIYPADSSISRKDSIIGTDGDSANLLTKNFEVGALIDFINASLNIGTSSFIFSNGLNPNIPVGTPGYFFSDSLDPISTTQLQISSVTDSGIDILNYFQYLIGTNKLVLKVVNLSKQNKVTYFNADAFTIGTNIFSIDVTIYENINYGLFINNDTYSFSFEYNLKQTPVSYQDSIGVFPNTSLQDFSTKYDGREKFYFDNTLKKFYVFDYGVSDWFQINSQTNSQANYKVFSCNLKILEDDIFSGNLIIGNQYIISILQSGDDFTNCGYVSDGVPFIATATTPTNWTNGTILTHFVFQVENLRNTFGSTFTFFIENYNNGIVSINSSNSDFVLNKVAIPGVRYSRINSQKINLESLVTNNFLYNYSFNFLFEIYVYN